MVRKICLGLFVLSQMLLNANILELKDVNL